MSAWMRPASTKSSSRCWEGEGRAGADGGTAGAGHLRAVARQPLLVELAQRHERFKTIEQERRVLMENLVAALRMQDEEVLRENLQARDWDESRRHAGILEGDLQRLREESEGLARE